MNRFDIRKVVENKVFLGNFFYSQKRIHKIQPNTQLNGQHYHFYRSVVSSAVAIVVSVPQILVSPFSIPLPQTLVHRRWRLYNAEGMSR